MGFIIVCLDKVMFETMLDLHIFKFGKKAACKHCSTCYLYSDQPRCKLYRIPKKTLYRVLTKHVLSLVWWFHNQKFLHIFLTLPNIFPSNLINILLRLWKNYKTFQKIYRGYIFLIYTPFNPSRYHCTGTT